MQVSDSLLQRYVGMTRMTAFFGLGSGNGD